MKRDIITIDERLCNGCGECVPNCPEGAIQVIDGKARLINDLFCDGLGACIGECPQGAISIERREAEPYDERGVMENVVKQGENTIRAHLKHLLDHGETGFYEQAITYLRENGFDVEAYTEEKQAPIRLCPGVKAASWGKGAAGTDEPSIKGSPGHRHRAAGGGEQASALSHWPIQMHLINPTAQYFHKCDLLLAADCTAFSSGGFHPKMLSGKKLVIACPKLDSGQERYLEKLVSLINDSEINTLTVAVMEVPCCGGLLRLAQRAAEEARRTVPIKLIVVGVTGELLKEEWVH